MHYQKRAITLGAVLWTTLDLAAQEHVGGSHCAGRFFDIELDFESPKFAEDAAALADKAWVAAAELVGKKIARPKTRFRIEVRRNAQTHEVAVRKLMGESRFGEFESRRPAGFGDQVAMSHTSNNRCALLIEDSGWQSADYAQWGFCGQAAAGVIDAAAGLAASDHQMTGAWWLREGIRAWIKARMLGARDRTARGQHPFLADSQYKVSCTWREGTLAQADELLRWEGQVSGVEVACMRELFFLLMERHRDPIRRVLDKLRNEMFPSSKRVAKWLKQAIGDDTDLEAEFREHCSRLAPEWRSTTHSPGYPGPRERLMLAGGSRHSSRDHWRGVDRAQPMGSSDYEISGRVRILDRENDLAALVFHQEVPIRGAVNTFTQPLVSIALRADGQTGVFRGRRISGSMVDPIAVGQGPKLTLGTAHDFRVSVNGRRITVHIEGKRVLTCKSPEDLTHAWGIAAPPESAAIWHDVTSFNRGKLHQWIGDLEHEDRAAEASRSLLALGPVALPFLSKRLAASPYLDRPQPDPVFDVIRSFGRRGTSTFSAVLAYLERCNRAQVLPVLDLLRDFAPFATEAVKDDIAKAQILTGPPPGKLPKAEWSSLCFELRQRMTVAMGAPVQALIRIVKSNRVFTREVAALALALRGKAAAAAVPALLRNMKSPKSLAKGARDLEVDGNVVVLRDNYYEECQVALVAIAPNDPRIYRVYSDRLRAHPDVAVRVAAAKMLGEFGDGARPAVPAMVRVLSNETEEPVLLATIGALAKMGKAAAKAKYHLGRLTRKSGTTRAVRDAATATLRALR